jgi:hypothetical protein
MAVVGARAGPVVQHIQPVPRWGDVAPFAVIGLMCVTAGGLVAAVTAAAPAEKTCT